MYQHTHLLLQHTHLLYRTELLAKAYIDSDGRPQRVLQFA
jgi:hypothetical protein